jgi:hypothetical protein
MTSQQIFGPNISPEITTPTASFSALNTFTDFSAGVTGTPAQQAASIRALFLAASGAPAPNWNPALPAKFWQDPTADTSEPDNIAVYYKWNSATGKYGQFTMPAYQAASVNIPGLNPLPNYVVAPTPATSNGGPFNPVYLVSPEDAIKLAAEWGLTVTAAELVDQTPELGFLANGETRRQWAVPFNGQNIPAGPAIAQQNAHGLNADGSWSTNGSWSLLGSPNWIPGAQLVDGISAGQPTSTVPVPQRNILGNEVVVKTLMGYQIEEPGLVPPAPVGSGGFTPNQCAWILKALAEAVPGAGAPPTN